MSLDDQLAHELMELHRRWSDEGRLRNRTQLASYYQLFRDRFGPERLGSLDGLALLELMHEHGNRDSLVYWLEFKDDEEFPAIFGSIAGGSALKFGIYRRRETGAWMTGSPQRQRELSLDEAIYFARRNRDQLLQGVDLLLRIAAQTDDSAYTWLQKELTRLAPDVNDTAWGHKYLSLLFPDMLDDFHNSDYQRFHLIKLLQEPPSENGRYLAAGRYVDISRRLDMPMNHLTSLLNHRNGRPHRYWRLDISKGAGNTDGRGPDENSIAIGWPRLGDLSRLTYNKESRERIRAAIGEYYPGTPQQIGIVTRQVFDFVARMAVGDIVLVSEENFVYQVARVVGGCRYEPDGSLPHRRPVEWLDSDDWSLSYPEWPKGRFIELRSVDHLIATERHLLNPRTPSSSNNLPSRYRGFGTKMELPRRPDLAAESPRRPGLAKVRHLTGLPGRIQDVLRRKGQVILYGPPGTGKTHWAELTARDVSAHARFDAAFADLTDIQRQEIIGDGAEQRGQVRLCSFHPAYGYEDFLEGYRPLIQGDRMAFQIRDGIFKQLCQDAQLESDQPYVLIVDEINRGDIPRIFGELLTILEKSKRGRPIILPLTGKSFVVPDNVFVIGTMNTADRSIALLDTALRRRFGFIEFMPDSSVLGDTTVEGIPLGPWLDALNQRICDHIGRDARNLQVGHSYLLDGGQPITEFAHFGRILWEDIIPLIEEYCYEEYGALEKILGKGLIDAKRQQIRHELFDPSRQADLVQALLAPAPEIATSRQAVISGDEANDDLDGDLIDVNGEPAA